MNRLVLIGNGFDIAHGLKTRYKDFINWYWKQRLYGLTNELSDLSDDGLCKMTILRNGPWSVFRYEHRNKIKDWEGIDLYRFLKKAEEDYRLESSSFFEQIHKSVETKGWVDIEYEYYSLLVLLHGFVEGNYRNLNTKLECLRDKLLEYLKLESKKECTMIEAIKEKIYCPIQEREIAVSSRNLLHKDEKFDPKSIMRLNFNYTKTPEVYASSHQNVTINYIHGNLDNPESIIFGYGDDLDKDYQKLKEQNDNEGLHHIKSIRYLESDKYRKMLSFIESELYQIVIMGHSCGNSDRTLLNKLFEHKNCVSIKPYYYIKEDGNNSYLELVQNIHRNFTDMNLMRDRVVNKEYTKPLTEV